MKLTFKCTSKCYPNSRFVSGTGPPGGWMIVGMAPGAQENEKGIPFVGGAGQILNQCLSLAGFHRSQFYITNVVKCQPPYNRVPTFEEVKKCSPYLQEELKTIQPTHIVALGEVASLCLTGKTLEWRGSIVPCLYASDIPVLITYHPAFVMRVRAEFSVLVHDLTKLTNPPPKFPQAYLINPSIQQFQELLDKWKDTPVAVDIETAGAGGEGLDPHTDKIIGIAFCGEPGVAVALTFKEWDPLKWRIVKEFLEGPTPKIFQNNLFDRMFLLQRNIKVQNLIWDTLNAMYLLHSSGKKGLDHLRSLYTSLPPYKRVYKQKDKGVSHLAPKDLGTYNCLDVDATLQVYQAQKPFFKEKLPKLQDYLLQLCDVALAMRAKGVLLDKEVLAGQCGKLQPKAAALETQFYQAYGVNIASPQQVAKLLFETKGLSPPRSARRGAKLSVDEEVLNDMLEYILADPERTLLKQILEYRETSKALNTYIVGWYKHLKADGRIHPDWKPTGTDTGRWACRSPNMQNPPKSLRGAVVAPRGMQLFIADYTQLELLTLALLADDAQLVEAIMKGEDVHEEVRQEMSKVVPANRMQAKQIVFGTSYGLASRTAAVRYHLPVVVIEAWQKIALGRFPKLVKFREKSINFFHKNGYVESWFGRRKYCETETQALNHPAQSTAADVTLHALLALYKQKFNPIITVHDENVCEVSYTSSLVEFKRLITNPVPELHTFFPAKVRASSTWKEDTK